MLLYLIVIIVSILITAAVNVLLSPTVTTALALDTLLSVTVGAVAVIAIDGLTALIIRRLTPTPWFSADRKAYRISRKERDLYRSLKIKAWKDKVPELGGFTGFHKNQLESTEDGTYLARFLLEANYGVVIHIFNAVLGFLVMLIPFCSSPGIWIPVFAVNFVLNLLPIAVLRYTSYTLQNL